MTTYDIATYGNVLTNLIPDSSFENDQWSGVVYSTTEHLFGSRSQYFASGGTYVGTIPISAIPLIGHIYYGRHYLKSSGDNQPADCRFEWFGGDGAGLNFVFGWNRGNFPNWTMESSIIEITDVNTKSFNIRSFVVNSTADMWADGLMIIDLTEAFGEGREPTKEWCDANIPYFEETYFIPKEFKLKTGDVVDCSYCGAVRSVTLPKGEYKLEVWGAEGGYRSSSSYSGKGGYSVGTLILGESKTVFLSSGQSGYNVGTGVSAFNGGGKRASVAQGGGGGSDIRIGQNSLYARIIVAGGGASDGASSGRGGYGGGTTGGAPASAYGTNNGPGTQTYSGSGPSTTASSQSSSTSSSTDIYGGFGFGGNGVYRSSGYGGAGGGGWYGGSGTYPDTSKDNDMGGAGGSGYVYTLSTASNYPSGCLLDSSMYLVDAQTIEGNNSFKSPTGTSETGHKGNGYCRITVIEIKTLNMWVSYDRIWRKIMSGWTYNANNRKWYPFTRDDIYGYSKVTINFTSRVDFIGTITINGQTQTLNISNGVGQNIFYIDSIGTHEITYGNFPENYGANIKSITISSIEDYTYQCRISPAIVINMPESVSCALSLKSSTLGIIGGYTNMVGTPEVLEVSNIATINYTKFGGTEQTSQYNATYMDSVSPKTIATLFGLDRIGTFTGQIYFSVYYSTTGRHFTQGSTLTYVNGELSSSTGSWDIRSNSVHSSTASFRVRDLYVK